MKGMDGHECDLGRLLIWPGSAGKAAVAAGWHRAILAIGLNVLERHQR
jgi:hypothetical protein